MWGMTLPKMAAAVHSFSAILGEVEMVARHSHTAQARSSMKTCEVMTLSKIMAPCQMLSNT